MMNIEYLFGKLPKKMNIYCGKRKIKDMKNINGFYSYTNDTIYINLGVNILKTFNDFDLANEDFIAYRIAMILQHECLHKTIYEITNKEANKWEEKILYEITGER